MVYGSKVGITPKSSAFDDAMFAETVSLIVDVPVRKKFGDVAAAAVGSRGVNDGGGGGGRMVVALALVTVLIKFSFAVVQESKGFRYDPVLG